jgi:hypothetical protein
MDRLMQAMSLALFIGNTDNYAKGNFFPGVPV